jgi:hypothetical protein
MAFVPPSPYCNAQNDQDERVLAGILWVADTKIPSQSPKLLAQWIPWMHLTGRGH